MVNLSNRKSFPNLLDFRILSSGTDISGNTFWETALFQVSHASWFFELHVSIFASLVAAVFISKIRESSIETYRFTFGNLFPVIKATFFFVASQTQNHKVVFLFFKDYLRKEK